MGKKVGFWKFKQVFDISRGKKYFFKCPNNGIVSGKQMHHFFHGSVKNVTLFLRLPLSSSSWYFPGRKPLLLKSCRRSQNLFFLNICILLLHYVIANKYLCDSYAQIGYKVPRSHCWVPQPLYGLMRDYILPCQEGGHQFIGTFIVKLWP